MGAAPGRAVIGGAACLRSQDARHQVEVRRQWAKPDGRVRWRLGKEASDLNRKSREFSPRTSLCAIRVVCLSAVENACSVIRDLSLRSGNVSGTFRFGPSRHCSQASGWVGSFRFESAPGCHPYKLGPINQTVDPSRFIPTALAVDVQRATIHSRHDRA